MSTNAAYDELMERQEQRLREMAPEVRAKVEETQRRLSLIGSKPLVCLVCGHEIERGGPHRMRMSPTDEDGMEFVHSDCAADAGW